MSKSLGANPGSRPSDQAPSGLGGSRFDPERIMRQALAEIRDLQPEPFAGYPLDWREQIDVCEECQRYRSHPIQQGICNEHRRPIWAEREHDHHERGRLGYRASNIADNALQAIATEARRAETENTGSVHEGAGPQDIAQKVQP